MNSLLNSGPNTKTVADLRAEIRKNMERELKNALVSRVKQQSQRFNRTKPN